MPALVFVVDHRHAQYAGRLSLDVQFELVRKGIGQSGPCIDYVRSTAAHLREIGVRDHGLEALVDELDHS